MNIKKITQLISSFVRAKTPVQEEFKIQLVSEREHQREFFRNFQTQSHIEHSFDRFLRDLDDKYQYPFSQQGKDFIEEQKKYIQDNYGSVKHRYLDLMRNQYLFSYKNSEVNTKLYSIYDCTQQLLTPFLKLLDDAGVEVDVRLVGGSIRDLVCNREIKDLDLLVSDAYIRDKKKLALMVPGVSQLLADNANEGRILAQVCSWAAKSSGIVSNVENYEPDVGKKIADDSYETQDINLISSNIKINLSQSKELGWESVDLIISMKSVADVISYFDHSLVKANLLIARNCQVLSRDSFGAELFYPWDFILSYITKTIVFDYENNSLMQASDFERSAKQRAVKLAKKFPDWKIVFLSSEQNNKYKDMAQSGIEKQKLCSIVDQPEQKKEIVKFKI